MSYHCDSMEAYKRNSDGQAVKWRSTVYFTDLDMVKEIEEYAEQHNVSESAAIVEILRNGQQALEADQ